LGDVDRELIERKEQYGRYHADYQRKCRELETLASLLNMCRDSIKRLEQDRSFNAAEDKRLSDILHPIKRCPESILRNIFEWVVYSGSEDGICLSCTRLSHVCQYWRTVALEMPLFRDNIYPKASCDNTDFGFGSNARPPPQDKDKGWEKPERKNTNPKGKERAVSAL
jgi:hypothetical protein